MHLNCQERGGGGGGRAVSFWHCLAGKFTFSLILIWLICHKGLEFLNTNQDLVALAEIKNMALNNKEHIEGLKRELAVIARHNKPAFTGVVTQSPGIDSSVLDSIREHLTGLQTEQEKLALTAARQHSEVVEDLSRKQVEYPWAQLFKTRWNR